MVHLSILMTSLGNNLLCEMGSLTALNASGPTGGVQKNLTVRLFLSIKPMAFANEPASINQVSARMLRFNVRLT
jgi:hypothetical protein